MQAADPLCTQPARRWVACLAMGLVAQACVSIPDRHPLPQELYSQATVLGIPGARYWGDEEHPLAAELRALSREELRARFSGLIGTQLNILAISGGGENGAFAAGLLNGWTASGGRPEFSGVTGISTGALLAPFAFLGPAYDSVIREMYTQYSTQDLVESRSTLAVLRSDAALDTKRFRELIAAYVDDDVMNAIAAEYRRGRYLFIGTTNLDAGRSVTWDIGRIADSGAAGSLDLIRDVMLASAAIPVAFPPVMLESEVNGELFDEMHVDGGASRQSFVFSGPFRVQDAPGWLDLQDHGQVYLIRNSKLEATWSTVDRKILTIAGRAASSMIRTQGLGDLYREYLASDAYGLEFNLAVIPAEFKVESRELFDPEYMRALYQLGFELAREGYQWRNAPPGLELPGTE